MLREKIIISDLDLKIMNFLKEERNINKLLDEFGFVHSQCKRHIGRLDKFLIKRRYGTFKFLKINENGGKLLQILG